MRCIQPCGRCTAPTLAFAVSFASTQLLSRSVSRQAGATSRVIVGRAKPLRWSMLIGHSVRLAKGTAPVVALSSSHTIAELLKPLAHGSLRHRTTDERSMAASGGRMEDISSDMESGSNLASKAMRTALTVVNTSWKQNAAQQQKHKDDSLLRFRRAPCS